MKGFILAAGEGVRLKPLTNYLPKPLLPVLNKPMIYYSINSLKNMGIKIIIANTYYKKDLLRTYLMQERVFISEEETLLGTAGGLGNAKNLILSNPDNIILLHNSDVITDFNLSNLIDEHQKNNALVTMALYDEPKINTVCLDIENNVIGFNTEKSAFKDFRYYTYTGIAVVEKALIEKFPFNKYGDLISYLTTEIKNETGSVKGYVYNNNENYWFDCGTIESYFSVNKYFYNNSPYRDPDLIKKENYYAYKTFEPNDTVFSGFNIIGKNVKTEKNVKLENTIVLDNTKLSEGLDLKNCIIGNDFIYTT